VIVDFDRRVLAVEPPTWVSIVRTALARSDDPATDSIRGPGGAGIHALRPRGSDADDATESTERVPCCARAE
jgi:hypothetical protein